MHLHSHIARAGSDEGCGCKKGCCGKSLQQEGNDTEARDGVVVDVVAGFAILFLLCMCMWV